MHMVSQKFWCNLHCLSSHDPYGKLERLTPSDDNESIDTGVKYGSRNVLADAAVREGIKKFSNWPTIPQVSSEEMAMERMYSWSKMVVPCHIELPMNFNYRLLVQINTKLCSNLQIFVKGEFIGGADILMSMHENGDLEKLLDPLRKAPKA